LRRIGREVFGKTVHPGDLVHADKHGAVVIPHEIAHEVVAAARKIENDERAILALCRSEQFSIEELDKPIPPE